MISNDSRDKIVSGIKSILDDDSAISLRSGRRLSALIKEISQIEDVPSDRKTISGSPSLSPGTVTINIIGIPDDDGEIESTLRNLVFDTVNRIIEKRSKPEDVEGRKFAHDVAQKYRDSGIEDDDESSEESLI